VTIAEDNLSLHARGRSPTAPTNDGNYADDIKKFLAFLSPRKYIETSSSPDINYLSDITSEYVKMPPQDRPKPEAAFTTLASVIVILGAIVAQIINPESALFPMIAAIGLSVLATIVLAHQQR
jgi:hypothetical protein